MSYSKGLEGVIAGETAISNVEGDLGRLSYRGYDIRDLVRLEYETVVWLLLFGNLPSQTEVKDLRLFLDDHGSLGQSDMDLLAHLPQGLHPMRMIQAMVPLLTLQRDISFCSMDEEVTAGLQIVAKMPSLISGFRRQQTAPNSVGGGSTGGYLERFLTDFTGRRERKHVDVLRVVQILQLEHSFNAGTFTGRVAASTLAPVDAVFSAATGALFGKLHGGADQAALHDAKVVGSPEHAEAFVTDLFSARGLLMGMGHREYRTVDPRAVILKPMAEELCRGTGFERVFETLVALETCFNAKMKARGKDVWANVEFYKGAVYEAIGIPESYFTALFALSRCVGWLAHFAESRQDNKIVRPSARYIGETARKLGTDSPELSDGPELPTRRALS